VALLNLRGNPRDQPNLKDIGLAKAARAIAMSGIAVKSERWTGGLIQPHYSSSPDPPRTHASADAIQASHYRSRVFKE
jgi:hypothetical protein